MQLQAAQIGELVLAARSRRTSAPSPMTQVWGAIQLRGGNVAWCSRRAARPQPPTGVKPKRPNTRSARARMPWRMPYEHGRALCPKRAPGEYRRARQGASASQPSDRKPDELVQRWKKDIGMVREGTRRAARKSRGKLSPYTRGHPSAAERKPRGRVRSRATLAPSLPRGRGRDGAPAATARGGRAGAQALRTARRPIRAADPRRAQPVVQGGGGHR